MKPHVLSFLVSRGVDGSTPMKCEWCFERLMVDVHHIIPKGMGGRKTCIINGSIVPINSPRNLIGLCLSCHEKAHKTEIIADDLIERAALILQTIEDQ